MVPGVGTVWLAGIKLWQKAKCQEWGNLLRVAMKDPAMGRVTC